MTGAELHERGKEIFLEASSLPPDERAEFVEAACAENEELRREVRSLLRHRDELPEEREQPASVDFDSNLVAGFRLLRRLGEGGMGEVFEAEQLRPMRRRVAIKLLKRGLETREVIARFESERQALALMSHRNVARVFEAGSTVDGRPYFAMEFVGGVSISAYCDSARLPLRDRLKLFVQVCRGVQHAHQRGVIHRDLKASNVLVTVRDDGPVPKVIDFGIAKATGPPLTERTLVTRGDCWMGTPETMSPEQAEGRLDIDTRSDVYSLGVLLYELLVGRLPFESVELREAGADELRRRIRHDVPTRPSAKVRQSGPAAGEWAANRRSDPDALGRMLGGDLDWIVMKALEKDRVQRYESPSALAADVERYLADQPVLAGRPSVIYRVRKFAHRHRVGVCAGLLLALSVALGTWGTVAGLVRARQEADSARRVARTLFGVLEGLDPENSEGEFNSPQQILERGALQIEAELSEQPVLQASLLATLGRIYTAIGIYDRAGPLLERAVASQRLLKSGDDAELARSLSFLGFLRIRTGQFELAQADLEESLAIRRRIFAPDSIEIARSLRDVGIVLLRRGWYEQASERFEEALAINSARLGPEHSETMGIRFFRAEVMAGIGRYEPARAELHAVLESRLARVPDHSATGWCLNSLGAVEQMAGNLAISEEYLLRALAILEASYGADHPAVGWPLIRLGVTLTELGRFEQARPHLERALRLFEARSPFGEPGEVWAANALGYLAWMAGEPELALPFFERAAASLERLQGPEHPSLVIPLMNLGAVLRELGDFESARPLIERGYELRLLTVGAEHPGHANDLHTLAKLNHREGNAEVASRLYEQALEATERLLGPEHPWIVRDLDDYAELLHSIGRHDRARQLEIRAARLRAG